MEVSEDIMPQNSYDEHLHGVAKGKRTKRQRTHRLSSATATVASSNSLVEVSGSSMEEEDEDLANCLILLAQGRALDTSSHRDGVKPMEAAASGDHGNNYVYRCRTCNKCFSSFQALGGHRTGHKRPKTPAPATMAAMERNKEADHEYDLKISVAAAANPETRSSSSSAALSGTVITAGGKPRSHECSICGLEFSSGQALGGHMRRHRSTVVPVYSQEPKKEKNVFDLDLNLPAPSEDEPESSSSATTFPITGKQALLLPSLVDCHY